MLSLAKDEPASERAYFLKKLENLSPGKNLVKAEQSDIKTLLEDVQAIKECIIERIEAIENGDYEALDDWDWEDSHDDDEPEMISEEQKDDLADLFNEAGAMFLQGGILASRSLYKALFDLSVTFFSSMS